MSRIVVLDTGPLGKIINPRKFPEIKQWLRKRLAAGERTWIPEIADYELRRGLLRLGDTAGIRRLDGFHVFLGYVPITTAAMRQAAEFWADARRRGYSTAPELGLPRRLSALKGSRASVTLAAGSGTIRLRV